MEMKKIEYLLKTINRELENVVWTSKPKELYEPINYILSLGGKRIRPILTIMGFNLYQETEKNYKVLKPALSTEVFHNFTLMHDDIMDNASLRRGKETVHEKWNTSTAILSGDAMMVAAYDLLSHVESDLLTDVLKLFNRCALDVCEGQQYDMNFETLDTVSESDYIYMIKLKTAALLGFSLELGARIGGASGTDAALLREFGINIGIGFQLKDDILDVYGDADKFGKKVGGDIIENKKTFLLIKALELAKGDKISTLNKWLSEDNSDEQAKVHAVTAIYDELGIKELALKEMNTFFDKGFEVLNSLEVSDDKKEPLIELTKYLIDREN